MDASLIDRATALAAEAESRRGELEERKAALLVEREDEVAKVRERFRARLDEIEDEIKLADRLRRALDPEGAKREAAARKPRPAPTPERRVAFRPSDEAFAQVLRAIEGGAETVRAISEAEGVTYSRGTVENVIPIARDEGLIRLSGVDDSVTQGTKPKTYRLTPQGIQHLRESMNGAHA